MVVFLPITDGLKCSDDKSVWPSKSTQANFCAGSLIENNVCASQISAIFLSEDYAMFDIIYVVWINIEKL